MAGDLVVLAMRVRVCVCFTADRLWPSLWERQQRHWTSMIHHASRAMWAEERRVLAKGEQEEGRDSEQDLVHAPPSPKR